MKYHRSDISYAFVTTTKKNTREGNVTIYNIEARVDKNAS